MYSVQESTRMTARTDANQAYDMAGTARVRGFQPCSGSPAVAMWSPISVDTTARKHGRPRRTEVSHP